MSVRKNAVVIALAAMVVPAVYAQSASVFLAGARLGRPSSAQQPHP